LLIVFKNHGHCPWVSIKLLLSFIIGGLWVIGVTVIADKFGSKIGGLIAGLPSTLLFGLFFIAWTQSPETAIKATVVVPIMNGASAFFLVTYATMVKKGLGKALFFALALWGACAYFFVLTKFDNFKIALWIYPLILAVAYYLFEFKLKIRSVQGKKIKYSGKQIFMRGVICGLMVFLSVFLGKVGGPILGGILAMFPAMFLSTMIITYLAHGAKFSAATAKSAMLSAISIVVYSIAVRYTYIPYGIIGGTLISTTSALLSGYLIYRFILSKII
jgi:uncharacterized membrane protein (GlpM family)